MAAHYAGADGCRAGWVTVRLAAARFESVQVYPDFEALVTGEQGAAALLVDIPMGLREHGPQERACDLLTRRLLGNRGSTLFRVPVRSAVHAPNYGTASALNRAATGKGISAQSFGICKKIAQVDLLLRVEPKLQDWVHESHPELCFAALNSGRPLAEKKKSPEGLVRRLELIAGYAENATETFVTAREGPFRKKMAADDILDAMVLALAARLAHEAGLPTIPAEPERDPYGLRMVIVTPR